MAFPHDGKKFQPGESGNPNGKPKGSLHIKTLAKRIFEDPDTWNRLSVSKDQVAALREKLGEDKTFGEALIYAWLTKSLTDPRFSAIVLELMDGKGKIEHGLDEDLFSATKLTIEVVTSDRSKTETEPEATDIVETPQ